MDFLQVIEEIKTEEASVQRLFGGEGKGVRTGTRKDPAYMERLAEAAEFIGEIVSGRRPVYHLREAMSTSDFPLLFGDVLDRQMLGAYQEAPQTYRNYCRVGTVPDFRTVKRFAVDGGEAVLAQVPQGDEYPEASLGEAKYEYTVAKYGRKMPFLWETLINDDLGSFRDIPSRFGRAARRSEEKFATGLFVDANGPHASLYTVGNANIVTANPALSVSALQVAMQILGAMKDSDGEPIAVEMVELVVPPALEVTALNILNGLTLELTEAGGTSAQKLIATNWMKGRFRLSVNPYIPVIASTANGATSWFLFASPSVGRPALEIGFLSGHEAPEVFVKEPNARRAGGGTVAPEDGDFDTDAVQYKIRHVFGGTRLDPKATVASQGDGT